MKIVMEIAEKAGEIIRSGWDMKDLSENLKGEINPVTEIDRNVEDFVTVQLLQKFPDFGILAEEGYERTGNGIARWIVDPLDGTTNFILRYPSVAVSIALERAGELVLGVVYNPIQHEMFTAEKGRGAFCNGKAIHVSKTPALSSAVIGSGFPYDAWENPDNNTAQWAGLIKKCRSLRCDGSAALDLCRVASGQFDGYWEKGLSPWDMAAGIVIAREAGGMVTDYSGGDKLLSLGEIIASNPFLHMEMKEIINSKRIS